MEKGYNRNPTKEDRNGSFLGIKRPINWLITTGIILTLGTLGYFVISESKEIGQNRRLRNHYSLPEEMRKYDLNLDGKLNEEEMKAHNREYRQTHN